MVRLKCTLQEFSKKVDNVFHLSALMEVLRFALDDDVSWDVLLTSRAMQMMANIHQSLQQKMTKDSESKDFAEHCVIAL